MQWRLINDNPAPGSWNMAVDEALLQSQLAGTAAPTLRFYGWEPACLSLGRLQKTIPDYEGDIVRRPTGGRAVWHQHEITYSVTFPLEALPPDQTSVIASYRWISAGFIEGLREFGIGAALARGSERCAVGGGSTVVGGSAASEGQASELQPARAVGASEIDCFAAAAACDFVVDGRKLIGAAQCRKKQGERTAVLQHGSLLLKIDALDWQKALGTPPFQSVALSDLGVIAGREEIIAALVRGVEKSLGIELLRSELNAAEITLAGTLRADKYESSSWLLTARDTTLA